MWKIGNIEIKNQVVLAPMAGLSNPAYIKICEEMGVGYAITELISSEAVFRDNKKTFDMLNGIKDINIPVAVQIFGSNPEVMADAARKIVLEFDVKIIDINMGCPVPKVAVKSEAGACLLKDIDKIKSIVTAVVKAVDVPVTVKIRSGWDEKSINAIEVAKAIEESGAKAICIHARTRSQGYSGVADWSIIKKVKESVSIPVIGNGDVTSYLKAKEMLDMTGCDAIMIGRAAQGNPWIIRDTVNYLENGTIPYEITDEDRINMLKHHLELLLKYKNSKEAILEIKTHALNYVKGLPNNAIIKNEICRAKTPEELLASVESYLKSI